MSKSKDTHRPRYTPSGIEVKTWYSNTDLDTNIESRLNPPGSFPFTRGVHNNMYRGRLWTMRQYAGFGSASQANERLRYLLSQGTTGLSIAFDLPTQMGRDSDHPLAKGEVGRVGVSISSVEDMEILLKNIPLEEVSISMTINATAVILLAFLLVVAERRKVSWDKLNGTIQNDILKEYMARGTYIYPPKAGIKLVTDICEFCLCNVPKWNTISVSGYHIREAGSTAVQELAFTLADGIAYLESIQQRGIKIDEVAPRIAFFFNCHNYFLEEIAKFRAARRMWARIMRDRFSCSNPRSMMLRFHTQTAGSSLTAQQPLNNVVRTTLQALAAVLGGTQSLHTNSYDEALGLPSVGSATLALRTQQIIAHESGVADIADPLGGAYAIESLTSQLEVDAECLINQIDKLGGMPQAIEKGFPQQEIEKSAYAYQRKIESMNQQVVGVNCFKEPENFNEASELSSKTLNSEEETQQIRNVIEFKKKRKEISVGEALSQLKNAAQSDLNLVPFVISAVRAHATLGEISDTLRQQYGEFASCSSS